MANLLSSLAQQDQAAIQNLQGGIAQLVNGLEERRKKKLVEAWEAWPEKSLEGAKKFVITQGVRPNEAQQFLAIGQQMEQIEDYTRKRKLATTPIDVLIGQTGTRATLPPEQSGPVRSSMFGKFGGITPEQMKAIGLSGDDILLENPKTLKEILGENFMAGESLTDEQKKIIGAYIAPPKPDKETGQLTENQVVETFSDFAMANSGNESPEKYTNKLYATYLDFRKTNMPREEAMNQTLEMENRSHYASAEEVKAAYQQGKLTEEEATKILQAQFGYK